MRLKIDMEPRSWPVREVLTIARGSMTEQPTLHLTLTRDDGVRGHGEACGIPYKGETPASMMAQIEAVRAIVEQGIDREAVMRILPSGGARMAIDSALWDLEAKAGAGDPFARNNLRRFPVSSAYTIGIRDLAAYEQTARELAGFPLLKVKVAESDPVSAIRAVRRGAPDAALIVDANQAWSIEQLKRFASELEPLGVALLEQPIPVGAEDGLDGWASPIPLCADELVDGPQDLDHVVGRFDVINIKLDKAGGLTSAMALADAAEARGLKLMVGCMLGSSLSMAPAMVLAQRCSFVDLDGPMLHATDVPDGFEYVNGVVAEPYKPSLWG
jgi:L-Ala-D/L-Glu epimerase